MTIACRLNGDDRIDGKGGNDTLIGGAGDDRLNGGTGFDTARFSGSFFDYSITPIADDSGARQWARGDSFKNGVIVTDLRDGAPDGVDSVRKVEVLDFSGRLIYLDGRNNAPIVAADSAGTDEDTALVIPISTLLANDRDFEGDPLALASVGNAVNGGVALDGADNVVFSPDANFNGSASFTYRITDGRGAYDEATVNVAVMAVNDAPVAANDTAMLSEDAGSTMIDVLANDRDVDLAREDWTWLTRSTDCRIRRNWTRCSAGPTTNRSTPRGSSRG